MKIRWWSDDVRAHANAGPHQLTLPGAGTSETWTGGTGDDVHTGTKKADTLDGGNGNDEIHGGNKNDDITGGDGNDSLFGDKGDDKFYGGNGDDDIDGGAGNDTAYYLFTGTSVTIDLAAGTASGGLGNDTLTHIENVWGGFVNDTITGDSYANQLFGGEGNDHLFGGRDNDTLYGGNGIDTLSGGRDTDALYGGPDTDVFVFAELGSPKPGTLLPVTHYLPDATGGETLDFSDIDSIPGGQDQAFLVVQQFNGSKGLATVDYEIATNQTVIRLDINGGANPQADFVVRIVGNHITGQSPETYDLTIIW